MRKIFITISILICSVKLVAQEINLPQYVSHMADNPFLISPSYAGIGSEFKVRLNGVSQWLGVKGSPDTQSLIIDTRLAERFGGGITVFNDKNGFTSQKGIKLSLASHLTLSQFHDSFLSFGLTYNFVQFGIDTSQNNSGQFVSNISETNSNFDVGLLYRYERFSISVNANNILDKKIDNLLTSEPESLGRYTLYTSYVLARISNKIEIEPSIFIEYYESDKRSRTDLNVKVRKGIYDGYVWVGASYTSLNDQIFKPHAIAPLVGLKKNNLYMSYGFSIDLNKTQNFNYGTHMITLGFDYDRRPSLARCTQKMIIF
ncbi:type IX secretion system membrane protein PorP/SprF [Tenacibaculum finnmarkense genomovar finnmarkense]|uniref:PorP/SprF family type IX secretion system membrane protein n=1 Tax=Tenacibaculum finnmarkense TaxID=2781243 RepID=UPI001E319703|nr:type IX secretion system membrane protein PorP/SprF [Tenacibaculum finnmarkense]MCD8416939.1 type IX secretion system membrane protein PorP/SprF [Tenacibaculum finnmarkense genomovar finnmarkense]MCG8185422.1 type IX secretion system membrane protein PorP/SprF [Tenacibaculum finnmarkense genomovar finnmarkense]MCG8201806.1 type IX secretion system membrane protein PorP/SprF [Tenacibaculum finnmarkense genomovar finnmarkense]MCG8209445.1 type IX secretion system membrane protein PorP/SprF [Te